MTLGGARVSVMPGHISDEPIVMERTFADFQAVKEQTATGYEGSFAWEIEPGQKIAVPCNFAWASQLSVALDGEVHTAGTFSFEVWSKDIATSAPDLLIGTIGIARGSYHPGTVVLASDISWPAGGETRSMNVARVVTLYGGYLVLNGVGLSVGSLFWFGEAVEGAAGTHYLYDDGAWGEELPGGLGFTASCGSPFTILRGLCYAYGGGHEWEIDLDDGHLYKGIVVDVAGNYELHPLTATGRGVVRDVQLTLMLTEIIL